MFSLIRWINYFLYFNNDSEYVEKIKLYNKTIFNKPRKYIVAVSKTNKKLSKIERE